MQIRAQDKESRMCDQKQDPPIRIELEPLVANEAQRRKAGFSLEDQQG